MISLIAGLILTVAISIAVEAKGPDKITETSAPPVMTECLTQCKSCQAKCEHTLSYCQKQGGKHTDAAHIKILKDCITTCKTSQDFMSRGSDLVGKACALCAEACKRCAESCATFKDKVMQDCADECRKCEQSCASMAK
jgi:hypothetical protein